MNIFYGMCKNASWKLKGKGEEGFMTPFQFSIHIFPANKGLRKKRLQFDIIFEVLTEIFAVFQIF